jgi:hypothetical protein
MIKQTEKDQSFQFFGPAGAESHWPAKRLTICGFFATEKMCTRIRTRITECFWVRAHESQVFHCAR